eukprot:gene16705-biopygen11324
MDVMGSRGYGTHTVWIRRLLHAILLRGKSHANAGRVGHLLDTYLRLGLITSPGGDATAARGGGDASRPYSSTQMKFC